MTLCCPVKTRKWSLMLIGHLFEQESMAKRISESNSEQVRKFRR
jgi:hypothetical protein